MTELSKLPDGWKWVRLGEVCEIMKGKKPTSYEKRNNQKMLPHLNAEVIRFGLEPKWCKISDRNSIIANDDEVPTTTRRNPTSHHFAHPLKSS